MDEVAECFTDILSAGEVEASEDKLSHVWSHALSESLESQRKKGSAIRRECRRGSKVNLTNKAVESEK